MRKVCTICAAGPSVVSAVNAELARETRLIDIAKMVGISKSAIGRHKLKCVPREILRKHKQNKFDPRSQNLFFLWPDHPCAPIELRGRLTPLGESPTEKDCIISVEYVSGPINNPDGLKRGRTWTAEGQQDFLTRCTQHVRDSYVQGQFENALAENEQHDRAANPRVVPPMDAPVN